MHAPLEVMLSWAAIWRVLMLDDKAAVYRYAAVRPGPEDVA